MSLTSPLRHPDTASPEFMRRRAWWLVALNLLIPGSAQLMAGGRRLGRIGVTATFGLWGALAVIALLAWLWPGALLALGTNPWVLLIAQWALIAYVLLWLILTADTLRLVRLVRVPQPARVLAASLAIVALVITAGGAGWAANLAGTARSAIVTVFGDADFEPPIDGRYTILLLGGDAGEDREGLRPDSISLLSVDAATGQATIAGIPRNQEFVPFPDGSPLAEEFPNGYDCGDECLISYLYTYGEQHPELYPDAQRKGTDPGVEAMRDAVEGLLDTTVQYYVLIDMEGFSDLIDALGGIELEVPERTPLAAAIPGATPFAWVEAGTQHLDGRTALWYARTRYESNDFERMQRQRDVQEAILRQFTPGTVLTRFEGIAEAGKQVVRTDIPAVMLGQFVELAAKSRQLPVTRLELVPPEFSPGHPDLAKIRAAYQEAVAPPTPGPTPTP